MKKLDIDERLNRIEDTIINNPFSGNKSLSSGNGGYIFDYDPEDELIVREFIKKLSSREDLGFEIQVFDLYEIMLDYLDKEVGLCGVVELEKECKDLFLEKCKASSGKKSDDLQKDTKEL